MSVLLETARLRLEDWTDAAVDELVAMHADAEVQRYLDPSGFGWSRDKAMLRLAEWQREARDLGLGKYRLLRRSDGTFVGRAGFSHYGDTPELGYSLARAHWGNGYATEIAGGLRDWFFETQPNDRFIAFAHRDNAGSLAVLHKIGMEHTGEGEVAGMPHQFFEKWRPQ
jgi:ribosomal-protein-alanine N-acetyltransferase